MLVSTDEKTGIQALERKSADYRIICLIFINQRTLFAPPEPASTVWTYFTLQSGRDVIYFMEEAESMTIQAVIFDIGGVLWRFEDPTLHRQWETQLELSEGQLIDIVFDNPISQQALVGDATPEEVWLEVAQQLALSPGELAALQADYWRGGVWDTDLLNFARSLKPRYKTGIISDAWSDARETIKEYVNGEIFDVLVFSAEEGVCKPNPEIFRRALSRLEVASQEAIFVDDMPRNVEGARQIGIQTIHFTNSLEVRKKIRHLLRNN
jgi:putative hydrolase of the HAD superfamily